MLLNIVIPLWLVEETDAPRVLLAFLFGTNTVMCIFLPMAAARGVEDLPTALRAVRISSTFFVVSCLITLATHDTVGWVTIALVWLGHVTVTGAELYLSAASWSFEAELMDPRQRGAYQGAAELSSTLGRVWAPAVYTFLAMSWGAAGWLVIAGIIVVATVGIHPSTRLARRFLEEHVPADVLADARASGPTPRRASRSGRRRSSTPTSRSLDPAAERPAGNERPGWISATFPTDGAASAFMGRQLRRGLLNPTSGPTPGSPWWRAHNLTIASAYLANEDLAGKRFRDLGMYTRMVPAMSRYTVVAAGYLRQGTGEAESEWSARMPLHGAERTRPALSADWRSPPRSSASSRWSSPNRSPPSARPARPRRTRRHDAVRLSM